MIQNGVNKEFVKKEMVDAHKEGPLKEYQEIKKSPFYLEFEKTGQISKNAVWKLYKVVPFTQETTIRKKIKLAEAKAMECNDEQVLSFIAKLLLQLD